MYTPNVRSQELSPINFSVCAQRSCTLIFVSAPNTLYIAWVQQLSRHVDCLREICVGLRVGTVVGERVGDIDGKNVGAAVGYKVGAKVQLFEQVHISDER